MVIDPNDLSRIDLKILTKLCEQSGKNLSDALREAVEAYLANLTRPAEVNGSRKSAQARKEAFRQAAGAWKDLDTDAMIDDIYALRSRPSRPVLKW